MSPPLPPPPPAIDGSLALLVSVAGASAIPVAAIMIVALGAYRTTVASKQAHALSLASTATVLRCVSAVLLFSPAGMAGFAVARHASRLSAAGADAVATEASKLRGRGLATLLLAGGIAVLLGFLGAAFFTCPTEGDGGEVHICPSIAPTVVLWLLAVLHIGLSVAAAVFTLRAAALIPATERGRARMMHFAKARGLSSTAVVRPPLRRRSLTADIEAPAPNRRSSGLAAVHPAVALKSKTDRHMAAARERGFDEAFVKDLGRPEWRAYFADVAKLRHLAATAPELLLLPWERLRAMGVLVFQHPAQTSYTFLSHQWEHYSHPFPDLLKITEHLDLVTTPFLWLDWYSVPQCAHRT